MSIDGLAFITMRFASYRDNLQTEESREDRGMKKARIETYLTYVD
jgi:hypothetical protein